MSQKDIEIEITPVQSAPETIAGMSPTSANKYIGKLIAAAQTELNGEAIDEKNINRAAVKLVKVAEGFKDQKGEARKELVMVALRSLIGTFVPEEARAPLMLVLEGAVSTVIDLTVSTIKQMIEQNSCCFSKPKALVDKQ